MLSHSYLLLYCYLPALICIRELWMKWMQLWTHFVEFGFMLVHQISFPKLYGVQYNRETLSLFEFMQLVLFFRKRLFIIKFIMVWTEKWLQMIRVWPTSNLLIALHRPRVNLMGAKHSNLTVGWFFCLQDKRIANETSHDKKPSDLSIWAFSE